MSMLSKGRGKWGKGAAALVFIAATNGSFANSILHYGLGSGIGRSGAGIALATDWSSVYYNPANLASPVDYAKTQAPASAAPAGRIRLVASERGEPIKPKDNEPAEMIAPLAADISGRQRNHIYNEVGIHFTQAVSGLNIEPLSGTAQARTRARAGTDNLNAGLMQLGVIFDLRQLVRIPYYSLPIRFGIALSMNANGSIVESQQLSESSYNFKRLGPNTRGIAAMFAIGLQLWRDRLSLGLSPAGQMTISANAQVSNISLNSENPVEINAVGDVRSKPAPTVGLNYRQPLGEGNLFLAFVYRMQTKANTRVRLKTILPLGLTSESELAGEVYLTPHTVSGGVGYRLRNLAFEVDMEYANWSAFKIDPTRAKYESPFNYQDTIALRAFASLETGKRWYNLVGTFGLGFIPPFTRLQNGTANYLDNTKYVFSLGLSKILAQGSVLQSRVRFDINAQWQVWSERSSEKSAPALFPDDSAQPNYKYGGNLWLFNGGVTLIFD